jgi:hypothetical protein
MPKLVPGVCALAVALPLLAAIGCSRGSSGSSPTTLLPAPTPAPVVPPPPTAPPTARMVEQGCTSGRGTADAACSRSSSFYLADMDAAIEQVVREHPEYFNLTEKRGEGSYRILRRDAYTSAVLDALGQRGYCAALDMYRDFFLLKLGDDRSEQFEIEGPSGFVRRGYASFWNACRPAAFPLEATAVVVKMWVGLYDFECDDPAQAPPAPEKSLPLSCDGYITATPKDKNLRTVPPSAHGPDIEWFVRNGQERIRLLDWNQPFNKRVVPLVAGEFSVCAKVLDVTGCFNGEIVR